MASVHYPHPRLVFVVIPLLVVLCSMALALVIVVRMPETGVSLGFMIGILYGQPVLAASWAVWGPASRRIRWPLSLGWAGINAGVLIVGSLSSGMHIDSGIAMLVLVTELCTWIVALACFWGLTIRYGWELQHAELAAFEPRDGRRDRQFSIRALLIVTTCVAVALSIGRVVATHASGITINELLELSLSLSIFAASSLPVVVALVTVVWSRWCSVLMIVALLVLTIVASVAEQSFLAGTLPDIPYPTFFHWLNAFTSGATLVFAVAVRLCGYRLGRRETRQEADRGGAVVAE